MTSDAGYRVKTKIKAYEPSADGRIALGNEEGIVLHLLFR